MKQYDEQKERLLCDFDEDEDDFEDSDLEDD